MKQVLQIKVSLPLTDRQDLENTLAALREGGEDAGMPEELVNAFERVIRSMSDQVETNLTKEVVDQLARCVGMKLFGTDFEEVTGTPITLTDLQRYKQMVETGFPDSGTYEWELVSEPETDEEREAMLQAERDERWKPGGVGEQAMRSAGPSADEVDLTGEQEPEVEISH